jgi:hypothetical protein
MQQSTKVRLLMVQTFHLFAVMYGAKGHDEGVKDKRRGRKEKLSAAFQPCIPETALF